MIIKFVLLVAGAYLLGSVPAAYLAAKWSRGIDIRQYGSGILLDIGCGEKPYSTMTEGLVSAHLGLDHPASFHSNSKVDIFATAYETALADKSVDTVLCTVVMEHLERPQDSVREMYRILKPGGHVILSVPLFWQWHKQLLRPFPNKPDKYPPFCQ